MPAGPPIRFIIGWLAHFVDAFLGVFRQISRRSPGDNIPASICPRLWAGEFRTFKECRHPAGLRVRWWLADFRDAAVGGLHRMLGGQPSWDTCSDSLLNSRSRVFCRVTARDNATDWACVFQVESRSPFRQTLVGVLMWQTRLERGWFPAL